MRPRVFRIRRRMRAFDESRVATNTTIPATARIIHPQIKYSCDILSPLVLSTRMHCGKPLYSRIVGNDVRSPLVILKGQAWTWTAVAERSGAGALWRARPIRKRCRRCALPPQSMRDSRFERQRAYVASFEGLVSCVIPTMKGKREARRRTRLSIYCSAM